MIRLLVRTLIAVAANAIGLIVAAIVLDGVHLNFASFVVAVVIFTVVFAVLQPFLAVQLRRLGNGAIGATALIATLVSLLLTDLLSDGLELLAQPAPLRGHRDRGRSGAGRLRGGGPGDRLSRRQHRFDRATLPLPGGELRAGR